jgi:hypothetical protein
MPPSGRLEVIGLDEEPMSEALNLRLISLLRSAFSRPGSSV